MHNVMLYVIHMFLFNISETYLNENTGNREFWILYLRAIHHLENVPKQKSALRVIQL